jgi:hypothetical protein
MRSTYVLKQLGHPQLIQTRPIRLDGNHQLIQHLANDILLQPTTDPNDLPEQASLLFPILDDPGHLPFEGSEDLGLVGFESAKSEELGAGVY